jgi:hypothetical protein
MGVDLGEMDQIMTSSISERLHLLKSYELISRHSNQLLLFIENILKNYRVFYLQKQENFMNNFLEEVKGTSIGDETSDQLKKDDSFWKSNKTGKTNRKTTQAPSLKGMSQLKRIFELVEMIDTKVRIPAPSSARSLHEGDSSKSSSEQLVNPLDALSRGILGKEVSELIQLLRNGYPHYLTAEKEIGSVYEKHLNQFNEDIRDFNQIMANFMNLKQRNHLTDQFSHNAGKKNASAKTPPRGGDDFEDEDEAAEKRRKMSKRSSRAKKDTTSANTMDSRPPFSLS